MYLMLNAVSVVNHCHRMLAFELTKWVSSAEKVADAE